MLVPRNIFDELTLVSQASRRKMFRYTKPFRNGVELTTLLNIILLQTSNYIAIRVPRSSNVCIFFNCSANERRPLRKTSAPNGLNLRVLPVPDDNSGVGTAWAGRRGVRNSKRCLTVEGR